VPNKSRGQSEILNIHLPEIHAPLRESFPEKGLYIVVRDGILPLSDKNFLFRSSCLFKSKYIPLSKPVKWKRTCQEKTSKTMTRGMQFELWRAKVPSQHYQESAECV
jgi:hypothetical protein